MRHKEWQTSLHQRNLIPSLRMKDKEKEALEIKGRKKGLKGTHTPTEFDIFINGTKLKETNFNNSESYS